MNFKSKMLFQKNNNIALFMLIIIFLLCGVITSMNDILSTKLKLIFRLNYFSSMFIQFCFFTAYFIISLLFYIISSKNEKIILKIGYKKIIILGLFVSFIGSFLFYPSSVINSYPCFLISLFILASGITLLQIGSNPYITLIGNPETASSRLSLTQAFNSLGSTIGPLIGGNIILNEHTINDCRSDYIKIIYISFSVLLFIILCVIKTIYLPNVKYETKNEKKQNLIKKYKNLKYGIIAIFMYVGAEVSIDSLIMIFLLNSGINISQKQASKILSLYWGGAMIGRFFGSVFLSNKNNRKKIIYITIIVILSLLYSYNIIKFNYEIMCYFWLLILLNIIAFIMGQNIPQRTLSIFSLFVILLLLIGSLSQNTILSISFITGIGLFNSIMFPTIFSLAVKNLKNNTTNGSSLLIMAIVGGAIFPLIQGKIADVINNVQISYLAPIICYMYLFFYGIQGYKSN